MEKISIAEFKRLTAGKMLTLLGSHIFRPNTDVNLLPVLERNFENLGTRLFELIGINTGLVKYNTTNLIRYIASDNENSYLTLAGYKCYKFNDTVYVLYKEKACDDIYYKEAIVYRLERD